MNLHEYQAKDLFSEYGIKVTSFRILKASDLLEKDIDLQLDALGCDEVVVKAQVHAGGRGKGGGVKLARNREEAKKCIKEILGMQLVTPQTTKDGIFVHEVMLTPAVNIEKEYYLSLLVDRDEGKPVIMCSSEGGMEIEEVAEKSPEKILKAYFSVDGSIDRSTVEKVLDFLQFDGKIRSQLEDMLVALAKLFVDKDASIIEINPLIETKEGDLLALDAKISIDSDALFRQKELAALEDMTQMLAVEAQAIKWNLAYHSFDGEIGCMVNGAGLAMATMDIIKHYGGEPANFLDVGGGADEEKVVEGFKLILTDPKVTAILVNIFGGIMKCDVIAKGLVAAAKKIDIKVPIVVRLEGTNVELGKEILEASDITIISAETLDEAAKKVTERSQ